ncbi:MAG: hypothetical protein EPN48_06540 [Microbacteriaceae bacterium]|nr:MAG: hypothetical protein EPN48_06540 [Microbacteriaceae bacterium]
MAERIHPEVLVRFGAPSAKPRVIRGYTAGAGWVDMPAKPLLTAVEVNRLRAAGYSMIEARWHLHTKQISLVQLH